MDKMDNLSLRNFLEKHTQQTFPDGATLMSKYLAACYNKAIDTMRQELSEGSLWVSVKVLESEGDEMVFVFIGKLDQSCKTFLVKVAILKSISIVQVITDALDMVEDGNQRIKILLTEGTQHTSMDQEEIENTLPQILHIDNPKQTLNKITKEMQAILTEKCVSFKDIEQVKIMETSLDLPKDIHGQRLKLGDSLMRKVLICRHFFGNEQNIGEFDIDPLVEIKTTDF